MHGLSQRIKSVLSVESVVNQFAKINIFNINAEKSALYLSGP